MEIIVKTSNSKYHNNNNNNNKNSDIDTFYCNYCKKKLSSRQSKWRHHKICTKNNSNTIEHRITLLENVINNNDFVFDLLDKQIQSINYISNIIKQNYFNKTILSLHNQLFSLLQNSIYNYIHIYNKFNVINKMAQSNIKILNKIYSFKNQNFFELVDKLAYISTKIIPNNNHDYESDSDSDTTSNSFYSDISDF